MEHTHVEDDQQQEVQQQGTDVALHQSLFFVGRWEEEESEQDYQIPDGSDELWEYTLPVSH